MPASIEELRPHLQAFDFPRLFVEGLGWDHYQSSPLVIEVDGGTYTLRTVAEKAGFAAYVCDPGQDGDIPPYPVQRKLEVRVGRTAFEHVIIFVDAQRTRQIWQWAKREPGKSPKPSRWEVREGQGGDPLLQRLQSVVFTLPDEARGIGISDVTSRVRKAFDVEKVTRRFYDRFRTELTAFGDFIEGITAQGDRDWYASLMLNRMMFIYFVQKKGFLDRDPDYLRTKLHEVQSRYGDGRFQQFYREFLLKLFHCGLGQPVDQRTQELKDILGEVPFLNGGLFDVHDLERDNPAISIPDAAFERVFNFFDEYRWHLDERFDREDNEINPDVLGYIFEKYVNQKQMGAYYTKEDITGYISRNTVIPFLFDAARKECPVAFGPDGGVWRLLRDDPDRYIYPAVGHGITWNARDAENPTRLDQSIRHSRESGNPRPPPLDSGSKARMTGVSFDLPDDIAAGIDDVSQRDGWNSPAHDDYALPTETWREVVARRQRYAEVRAKLASGEVTEINDLITFNLDIERFALDVIAQSEGPELLRAFWHAMRDVSVLDPTCGSGAFLFAALNVLEPLYTGCLEGMRGFLDDLERSERPHSPNALSDFREVLGQVEKHPSERYFILKSIVLNNLYGVDIMEEAVEICKLRLFLKLVAQLESYDQIEPLPDIDFNVRAGNTLVGFTSLDAVRDAMTVMPNGQHRMLSDEDRLTLDRINEDAEIASAAFNQFRWQQTMLGGEVTSAHKQALGDRLRSLADELDRLLAAEYGVDPTKAAAYDAWSDSHQPFHWFVEFYGIMSKGGFDVVIGNPPYVEYSKVKDDYTIRDYATESCGNLYAFVLERCKSLANQNTTLSMIVPLSGHSTKRMTPLVESFYQHFGSCHLMNISGDANPSRLFPNVKFRLVIFVVSNNGKGMFTSGYKHFYADERDTLFSLLSYTDIEDLWYETAIPKVSSVLHRQVLRKLNGHRRPWLAAKPSLDNEVLYHSAPVNWIRAHTYTPYFHSERDGQKRSTELKSIDMKPTAIPSLHSIICSTTFFIWWVSHSDCYHLNKPEIFTFPMLSDDGLDSISCKLEADMQARSKRRVYNYKTTGRVEYDEFYLKLSKSIIDEIDRVLAQHYGFTDEELDFIINYDIKYRMGRER